MQHLLHSSCLQLYNISYIVAVYCSTTSPSSCVHLVTSLSLSTPHPVYTPPCLHPTLSHPCSAFCPLSGLTTARGNTTYLSATPATRLSHNTQSYQWYCPWFSLFLVIDYIYVSPIHLYICIYIYFRCRSIMFIILNSIHHKLGLVLSLALKMSLFLY